MVLRKQKVLWASSPINRRHEHRPWHFIQSGVYSYCITEHPYKYRVKLIAGILHGQKSANISGLSLWSNSVDAAMAKVGLPAF